MAWVMQIHPSSFSPSDIYSLIIFWRNIVDVEGLHTRLKNSERKDVPKNWVSGLWRNELASWNRLFFIFYPIFLHIWCLFLKWNALRMRHDSEKSLNIIQTILAKNEENPCSTCLKPISRLIPATQKSDFKYPICHYTQEYVNWDFTRFCILSWISCSSKKIGRRILQKQIWNYNYLLCVRTYKYNLPCLKNYLWNY